MEPCLLCGHTQTVLHDDVRDYEYGVPWRSELVICSACGLVSQSPRVRESDLPTLYPANYHAYGGKDGRGVYWQLRQLLSRLSLMGLLGHVPRGGRLLEVGSGNGSFLRLVKKARPDIELHGVDIADTGLANDPSFTFHRGQLEQLALPPGYFDAIYFSNLIEHVPDPRAFLKACRGLLKPGGIVYGTTPDHLSLDRWLFGKYWAGYHYPRHTFVFDHHNLPALLEKCGYHDVRLSGSYAFWSLSLKNRFREGHGPKKRGLAHATATAVMLPFDLMINAVRCHGAMTFVASAG